MCLELSANAFGLPDARLSFQSLSHRFVPQTPAPWNSLFHEPPPLLGSKLRFRWNMVPPTLCLQHAWLALLILWSQVQSHFLAETIPVHAPCVMLFTLNFLA